MLQRQLPGAVPPVGLVPPAPPLDGGVNPPVHRPDVPCETQDPPNLEAPQAQALQVLAPGASPAAARRQLRQPSGADKSLAGAMLRRAVPKIEKTVDGLRAQAAGKDKAKKAAAPS